MSTVLVTGCSSGFGELIAKTMATHGHHVYATMRAVAERNFDAAERLRAWAAGSHCDLSVVEMDVTDDGSVQVVVEQVLAAEGMIDVVVNNAGGAAAGPLEAFSVPQMAGLLD